MRARARKRVKELAIERIREGGREGERPALKILPSKATKSSRITGITETSRIA